MSAPQIMVNNNQDDAKDLQLKPYSDIIIRVMVFLMLTLFILFVVHIVDIVNVQDHLKYYSSPSIKECWTLCQDYHIDEYLGVCCDFTGRDCLKLSECRSKVVGKYQEQYDGDVAVVVLSSIGDALFVAACWWLNRLRAKPPVKEPVFRSLQEPINGPINDGAINNQDGEYYDSFLHYDRENSCVVCIENFNHQQTVLLNCGHLYHSKCIKDWTRKQKNCPACRSSQ